MAGARNFGAWAALLGAAATAAVLLAAAGPADAAFPGVNGRIAFSQNPNVLQQSNASIYTVRPDGKGQARLTRPGGTMSDTSPSYAPSGRRIVFERYDTSIGCSQIFSIKPDGSGLMRLTGQTSDGGCNFAPAWGPGGRIAFASTRDGNAEVYVMNADGTNQTNLSNNPGVDQAPAFSPDGEEIAFETRRESDDFEVYKMDADGTDPVNLTDTPGVDGAPNFSPGGGRIAFESDRESSRDVYVMSSNGSNPERLTTSGGQQPAFSPGGGRITYSDGNRIFKINSSNNSMKRRVSNGGDLSVATEPDWGVMPGS